MGHADAKALFERAAAIARSGRPEDGVRFIEETAGRGDPDANIIVAHWLLYGSDRSRDPGAACCHLERAGESGSAEALRILAHLTASGTGHGPDREQALELLKAVSGAGDHGPNRGTYRNGRKPRRGALRDAL